MANLDLETTTDIDLLFSEYNKLYDSKNFEDAIHYLKRILEISPKNVSALIEIAYTYDELDLPKLSIQYAEEALSYQPNNDKVLYNLGVYYKNIGDYDTSKDYYNRALVINPDDCYILTNLAIIETDFGDNNKAILLLEKAISLCPKDKLAWYNLGRAYDQNDDYSKAIDCNLRATRIDSNYSKAWSNLGVYYGEIGNEDNAKKCYKKAILLDNYDSISWSNIGLIYLKEYFGTETAIKCFIRAHDSEPEKEIAWRNLGDAFFDLKSYNTAVSFYLKALEINPDITETKNNLELARSRLSLDYHSDNLSAIMESYRPHIGRLIKLWQNENLELDDSTTITNSTINTNRTEDFRKMLKRFTKLSINEMVELLEFTNGLELKKWLMELPDDISFKVDDEYVVFNQLLTDGMVDTIISSLNSHQAYTCYDCGLPIEKETKICSDCGKEIINCAICKLPISFGDETITCSNCKAIGHFDHFSEWIKINGSCPRCKTKLIL